ncbi:DUF3592 domain-containing protein [Streptomyces sp. H39-S7]|uniref:DUF3592 domain-containing protein n=1 Tax=Streptomyces sp. H39-S7 TaxID=3004357 RepID=UPI0022AEBAC7|nr:DUF3592 domain-containing protein [Streptomyces sp. H39-S7]MCZ4117882.1 hypothetical protein [Streptomyces sp. H39-S7]
MNQMVWVGIVASLIPLPFLVWLGIYPLLVDRRLRRVGIRVPGLCRGSSVSEGRYSTSFEFADADGYKTIYISPLSAGPFGYAGEEIDIVFDPKNPDRRARSIRELEKRSEAWFSLWWMMGIEMIFLVGTLMIVIAG